ncbi:hypothetical protein EAO72_39115 [Streptomyces sp. or43]|nr:hypothetical protein EAO72_39115 [Streptomyces sp. or43]
MRHLSFASGFSRFTEFFVCSMTTGYGSGRGSLGEAGEDDEVPSGPAPEPGPVESAAFIGSEGADEDPRPGADAVAAGPLPARDFIAAERWP